MIYIDEDQRTLYLTKNNNTDGVVNRLSFYLPYFDSATNTEKKYEFVPEDKISFIVVPKKGYTKEEILRKEYTLREIGYFEPTQIVEIPLSLFDTDKFPASNKAQTYNYEIILNDSLTIIGHDPEEGGAKLIVLPTANL